MPLPVVHWDDLSDADPDALIDQAEAERRRRWHLRRGTSWVEEMRERLASRPPEES